MPRSNHELVNMLAHQGVIRSERVKSVMLQVDRGQYCSTYGAYDDSPQSIGHGVTISAPHMHAMCLELLQDYLRPGCRALDVGSGSGYLTVCMALMCGEAHGIEYIKELVPTSVANIRNDGKQGLLDRKAVTVRHGDGSKGLPALAPFSAIHVGAAAPAMPQALLDQLAAPGRMIIPVGPQNGSQYLVVVDKDAEGRITEHKECGVRYVPLHM